MSRGEPAPVRECRDCGNALRKLTEVAEAQGWTAGKADGKLALYAPGLDAPAACVAFGLVMTAIPVPVELMALLLEAVR